MSVYLLTNGLRHAGWTELSIKRSLEHLSGEFEFSVTEKWPGQDVPRTINKGDTCQILMDSDVVITGHVDSVKISYDKQDHKLTFSGRDTAGDLVDSSATLPGQLKGQKLEKVVHELVKDYKIPVAYDIDTEEPFDNFAALQGEKVQNAITRACKMRAALCIPDRKGGLLITRAGNRRAADELKLGVNILKCDFEDSDKGRHSQITVKGQTQGSTGSSPAQTTSWSASVADPEIKRHRPLIIVAETQAHAKACHNRASVEHGKRKAKGKKVTYTVQGWRQSNGELWDINTLVFVDDPFCKLQEVLLVLDVAYKQDDDGTTTELTLVDKEAYNAIVLGAGKHHKGKKGKGQPVVDQTTVN
jgi:prophage tail gpP-like protein